MATTWLPRQSTPGTEVTRQWLIRWLAGDQTSAEPEAVFVPIEQVTTARPADALYREIAMQRLGAQLGQVDLTDTKASTLFTIGSTILPITAGLLATEPDRIRDSPVAFVALCAGSVSYLL